MRGGEGDCCVVVVGAGAAGALTASHLVTGLSSRYRVALVDPVPARPVAARRTPPTDDRHLLNVPASGMSAFPRDPEHFFRWVRTHHDPETQPQDFVPRRVYGDYVVRPAADRGRVPRQRPARATHTSPSLGIDRRGDRFVVRLSSGESIVARAVVLATGSRPGTDWAPAALADVRPARRRPLDPGAARRRPAAGRHRPDHGRRRASPPTGPAARCTPSRGTTCVPEVHRLPTTPAVPPPPGITRIAHPRRAPRRRATRTSAHTVDETGDWRAAIDGLRPVTAQLWQGLDDEDKRRFLADHARTWDVHRHRMPPVTAGRLDADRRRRAAGPPHRHRWSTPARSPAASR